MKKIWFLVALCGLLVATLSPRLHPYNYQEGRSRDPRLRVEANRSYLARILGEFRTGMSDMLFIITERYLHSGVGYVPHLTEELLTVQGTEKEVDSHQEEMREGDHHSAHEDGDPFRHEEEVETLLPTAKQDYRGWIGRMHREVKPWRDPSLAHQHTDGKELIPWFKLMTVSDPGYIRGYLVGAFWVQQYNREAAESFIDEGLVQNPDAFQLYLSKGFFLMGDARQLSGKGVVDDSDPEQRALMLEAKEAFRQGAELMMAARPARPEKGDVTDDPNWGYYLESDALAVANLAVLFEKRYGDAAEAERLRQRLLQIMPEHRQLQQP